MTQHDEAHRQEWHAMLKRSAEVSERSWKIALLLSVLFGFLGADRFYARRPALGMLKLATVGLSGIWWVIDIVLLLSGRMKDSEGKAIRDK